MDRGRTGDDTAGLVKGKTLNGLTYCRDGGASPGVGGRARVPHAATVETMESYELAEAAERAGVSPDELRELVELGILQPDAAGRFSEGDVRRVGVVQSTVAAGIPIDLLADSLRSGQFSLAFMDDPAYDRFTSLTGETFQELSARTGLPLHLLIAVREAAGGVTPAPEDRVREGERPIVTLLEFQVAHGFRPITLERSLRVFGDSLRRIAETGGDTWRSEVLEPLFAAGKTGVELGAASSEVSEGMTELDEEALLALYRAHQARVWTANIIGASESILATAGLHSRLEHPPAMCFLDITGYTRLTQERGDAAAADLASSLARVVRANIAAPWWPTDQVAWRWSDVLLPKARSGGDRSARDGGRCGRGRTAAGARRSARRARWSSRRATTTVRRSTSPHGSRSTPDRARCWSVRRSSTPQSGLTSPSGRSGRWS